MLASNFLANCEVQGNRGERMHSDTAEWKGKKGVSGRVEEMGDESEKHKETKQGKGWWERDEQKINGLGPNFSLQSNFIVCLVTEEIY